MKAEAFDAMERQLCGFILEKVSHKNICDVLVRLYLKKNPVVFVLLTKQLKAGFEASLIETFKR